MARTHETFPALDRSDDWRPTRTLEALTSGVDGRNGILLTDLNWQVQNGLTYFTKHVRPAVVDARLDDVLLYLPALVRDNTAIGRDVVLTRTAVPTLANAFGPMLSIAPDARTPAATLSGVAARVPRGSMYCFSRF